MFNYTDTIEMFLAAFRQFGYEFHCDGDKQLVDLDPWQLQ